MLRSELATDSEVDEPPVRRVREEVKDGVAVIVTSAAVSMSLVAVAMLLLMLTG
ncbi:MAG: hypothetical protein ACRDQA_13130 [Nocardioidaceae bacterium]